jgi:hypothetical protein
MATEDQEDVELESPVEGGRLSNSLARMMERTGLLKVVEIKEAPGQSHLMCRVDPKNERELVRKVVEPILRASYKKFDLFFGKQYFLKDGRDMVYAWVLSLGAEDLDGAVKAIGKVLELVLPDFEVMEMPLSGPSAPRGGVMVMGTGASKGASPLRG